TFRDPGGPSSFKVQPSNHEHILLDVLITDTQKPEAIIIYKNTKTNKITVSPPNSTFKLPKLGNIPQSWLTPVRSITEGPETPEVIVATFEIYQRTRISTPITLVNITYLNPMPAE